MNHVLVLLTIIAIGNALESHLGTFRGTARNASGILQLGSDASATTVFELDNRNDSLALRAITKSGRRLTVAVWPMGRVSVRGSTLTAQGLRTGPLHQRRTLDWNVTAGIRVSATLTTNGASQKHDDFFGGGSVQLTLLKVR
ncbi:MAG: hypothetical protein RL594_1006 [Bacteroidota bacterium]|jgi:hypothetical protein